MSTLEPAGEPVEIDAEALPSWLEPEAPRVTSYDALPLIMAAAAIAAGLSGQAPTGNAGADFVLSAGFAGLIVWMAHRAPMRAVVVSAVLAMLFTAFSVPAALTGLLALSLAVLVMTRPTLDLDRKRLLLAACAGFISFTILHLPSFRFVGTASIAAAIAVAPILIGGFQALGSAERRQARLAAIGAAVFALVAGALAAIAGLLVLGDVESGIAQAEEGISALEAGDQEQARGLLSLASDNLERSRGVLGGPLTWPSKIVPILGHQTRAVETAVEQGATLAATAERVVTTADVEQIRGSNGAIDLDLVRRLNAELSTADAVMTQARSSLREVRTPWLLPPLDNNIADVEVELATAAEDIALANLGTQVMPRILGGDGLRRYMVMFTQPAEAREFGGFMSAYAMLEADNGQLRLAEAGPALDILVDPDGEAAFDDDMPPYPQHYLNRNPQLFPQNLPSTADLFTIATAAAELVPKWKQDPAYTIDGVIALDPYALAAMLELTGPIPMAGRSEPATADTIVEFLLRGQYEEFDPEDRDQRLDSLGELAGSTFERLLSIEVPGPEALGRIFGPVARENRLAFATFDFEETLFLEQVHMTAPLPEVATGVELVGVYAQTGIASKLAAYETRDLRFEVVVDPGARVAKGTGTISIANDVPVGASPYVTGEVVDGLSPVELALYTRSAVAGLDAWSEDEEIFDYTSQSYAHHSGLVDVPRGETAEFSFTTEHQMLGNRYDLLVLAQPVANVGRIDVVITPSAGWRIAAIGPGLPEGDITESGSWVFSDVLDVHKPISLIFESE